VNVNVNGKNMKFQVDTAATISILSKTQWKLLGYTKLNEVTIDLKNYDGSSLKTTGVFKANVIYNSKEHLVDLVVINADKPYGLLGRDIISSRAKAYEIFNNYDILPAVQGFKLFG